MAQRWPASAAACFFLALLVLAAAGVPAAADSTVTPLLPAGRRGDADAAARFRLALDGWLDRAARGRPLLGSAAGDEVLSALVLRPDASARFDRVVLVSIDGLRPDALGASTPHLARLAAEGATAAVAETIQRSTTLPSHASMLTGVGTAAHGITWNGHRPERGKVRFPTVLRIARAAGLRAAAFVGKSKLAHLVQDGDTDAFEVGGSRCHLVNRRARPYLETMPTGLAVLHYPDPDGAGHRVGWMTDEYAEAVARADACVGELLTTLAVAARLDRTLVVITSDHGGHERTHGSSEPSDLRIPWIAWSPAVAPGVLPIGVRTTDTAPTILRALGLPVPLAAEGRPVALPLPHPSLPCDALPPDPGRIP